MRKKQNKPKTCQWVEGLDNQKDFPAMHKCRNKARVTARKGHCVWWVCFTHAAEAEKNYRYQIR